MFEELRKLETGDDNEIVEEVNKEFTAEEKDGEPKRQKRHSVEELF